MLHWVLMILGAAFVLFQLVFAYLIFSSLMENTGYTSFSVAAGLCMGLAPVAVVWFGYRWVLGRIALWGLLPSLLAVVICAAVYLGAVLLWCRMVLGEVPETWQSVLWTVAFAALSGGAIFAFLRF